MKLGLENITSLLASLEDPQMGVRSVLVGGTNGKGSTATLISSILRSSGLRTGTFYSPHLFRINERIRIDGDEIPGADLDRLIGRCRESPEKSPFTFFEGVTAAAALWFAERKVDAAVYEVGLGGRLDATRLVDARTTVITGISLDHREHLGGTRKAILREKLGIARPGVPLVAALPEGRLERQAEEYCSSRSIPFHSVSRETAVAGITTGWEGTEFLLETATRDYGRVRSGMIGKIQAKNAAAAVRACEIFMAGEGAPSVKAVAGGLASSSLPGRFQVLPGRPRIVLDVSHNEEALLASLDTLVSLSPPERNVMIFGVMARKQTGRFPRRALRSVREVILVPLGGKGAARGEDLARIFGNAASSVPAGRRARIHRAGNMGAAVRRALGGLDAGDTLIVLGSHTAVEAAVARM